MSVGVNKSKSMRIIAFYLPQFHPIPENDRWWGNGFTEWVNVAKARPLFPGHYQPRLPGDLGFYDLRLPETRLTQAEMAKNSGIEGFCYWHYWFGAGKRLLERPFQEVLVSGEPDFPFCLAWANQTWTGVWHGAPDRILMEQAYHGLADYTNHFYDILNALADHRYISIDGRKLFVVYRPRELPEPIKFTDCWRELALRCGLEGLYFVGISDEAWVPEEHGFDASIRCEPDSMIMRLPKLNISTVLRKLLRLRVNSRFRGTLPLPEVYSYRTIVQHAFVHSPSTHESFPCVLPNWDTTPRCGSSGIVFHDSTPELFRTHLEQGLEQVLSRSPEYRIVFIKSWNEWAEGNYLEPDRKYGHGYLQVLKEVVCASPDRGSIGQGTAS